ncbi:MAG: 3-hydroxyacyl-CoA dehydrogenase NAD-binding domain-containing protein [Gammaproteobacteria bacterium]|nr:3-hydroxyacyl-CoA dehydrogenase NAD-binding domain-containing protein [Gammaproteobacteria bacterium]
MKPAMDRILDYTPLETGRDATALDLSLQHWQARLDDDHVLWLIIDQKDATANTVCEPVIEELAALLGEIERRQPKAVVVRSGKPDSFMVGADIEAFRELTEVDQVLEMLERAHDVVNRLAGLDCPTVAMLHGHCLGGGLELALACDYRLARSDTSLGFPEVQLGLHPGLGGTARLPQLIRPDQALQMMLTGKPMPAGRARALGLVDALVEERHVAAAVAAAAAGRLTSRASGSAAAAMRLAPARRFVAGRARKETGKRVSEEHYPAPFRLLDLWEAHGHGREAMLEHEPRSFAELLTGDTARNLIRVYFLREGLRAQGKREAAEINHVHVIGAGTMGGDIAAWCAHQGLLATLEDREAKLIAPAMKRAAALFEHKYSDARERRAAADRLIPDPAGAGRARADLIIEAVPEKLELKQRIFTELEAVAREDAILASNTSGILLEDIGSALDRPERLAGVHFFNPVARMQLVEVVGHDRLDETVRQRLCAFATAIDRLPVRVSSAPGFLVNRILTPYLLEALLLVDEGVAAERVDAAAEAFGMPIGPVELADQIGLDIALDVADGLRDKLDTPMPDIPDWLRRKVDDGDLGVKTGKGLYQYKDGKADKSSVDEAPDPEHIDRLVLPMVNTAVECLGAGVVDDPDALDGALIFGTGFAPFRGGPLHYARQRGADEVRQRLRELAAAHGDRFRPSEAWEQVFSGS